MKRWKLVLAVGVLAVYLSGCQGNADSASGVREETTVEEVGQEEEEKDGGEEMTAGEGTSAADAEEIKSSNPMQEVSGTEALSEIGVAMELPEDVKDVQCFIISQVVAEVNFSRGDTRYTYRGSATAEDFAGIFEEFEEEVVTVPCAEEMGTDGDLVIKTTKSGGKLAGWAKNGASYTLYTPAEVEEDVLVALCRELMGKN